MVLTNIIGTKLFMLLPDLLPQGFGGLTGNSFVILTTGILTYPLTFLLTDVVAEVFGKKRADFMVFLGFCSSILMLGVLWLGVSLPRADRYWSDASGQWEPGTTIVGLDHVDHAASRPAEGRPADTHQGKGLLVDDHSGLITTPSATAAGSLSIAVLPSDAGADLPILPAFTNLSGSVGQPGRWDGHGALLSDHPWPVTARPGAWVVPAVTITAVDPENTTSITVDRPAALPPNGTVLDARGWRWEYRQRHENGTVSLVPYWQTPGDVRPEFIPGQQLAVANTLGPAQMQTAYSAAFAAPALLLLASMTAYLVAQLLDVWLYHFWRRLTKGRHLWLRNNGSTWISQLVDTCIVNGIFLPLAFGMDFAATTKIIIAVYLVKITLAAIDTPLIYLTVFLVKKRLGFGMREDVPDLLEDSAASTA
jgi:uncharacterized PurR-regulated membrane protein YhhQ (DUF165 family)